MGRPCRRLGWRGLGTGGRAPYKAAAWAASSFFLMSTFLSKETVVPRARVPTHSDFLSPYVGVPSLSFSQEGHQGHSESPVPLLEQKVSGPSLRLPARGCPFFFLAPSHWVGAHGQDLLVCEMG